MTFSNLIYIHTNEPFAYTTFRNFSMVDEHSDEAEVMITSLVCMCSRAWLAMFSALVSSSVMSSFTDSMVDTWAGEQRSNRSRAEVVG